MLEIGMTDERGDRLALHKAVRGEHLEIIELLLACGADTSVCDVRGDTAAALAEDQNMAARLIARLRS